jgi:hypothetical protein
VQVDAEPSVEIKVRVAVWVKPEQQASSFREKREWMRRRNGEEREEGEGKRGR